MGSDMVMSIFAVFDRNFNPRSRMGSDRPFRADPRYKYHFNPRSRMGSDLVIVSP